MQAVSLDDLPEELAAELKDVLRKISKIENVKDKKHNCNDHDDKPEFEITSGILGAFEGVKHVLSESIGAEPYFVWLKLVTNLSCASGMVLSEAARGKDSEKARALVKESYQELIEFLTVGEQKLKALREKILDEKEKNNCKHE